MPSEGVNSDTEMARSTRCRTLRILCQLMSMVVLRFWKMCTSASLILLIIYWFKGGVFTLVFLVIALYGIFYYAQDMFLYYPEQPPNSRIYVELPDKLRIPYENQFIQTSDGVKINVVLLKYPNPGAATVMLLHGNAGNIGHRLMTAYFIYMGCQCNVLLLEYRGYGKSGGTPSESGLYIDAEAGMTFLLNRTDLNRDRIIVMGCSLGGAVAIKLATSPKFADAMAGLVLENTFTSLPDVARSLFSLKAMDFLPTFCYKNKFPSEYRIGRVGIPILFMSGLSDELIPPHMMTTLYNLSSSRKKKLAPFEGGTHNDTASCPGYYETLAQFVSEALTLAEVKKARATTVIIDTDGMKTV